MNNESINSDTKNTVKSALLNTIANFCSLIIGVIMIPIITRVISQYDLGIASTFLANRNILVIFVTLSVYAFVHKAMLEFSNDKKNYIFTISVFCVFIVGAVFAISLPFKEVIKRILSLDDFLYYWLFISILSFALYSIANYYCIFHNYSVIVFMIVLSIGPIAQFLSVGLSYVFVDNKYIGRVLGLDAAYFIVSVVLLISLIITGEKKFYNKYLVRTLKFTVPIIPHLLSQMVLTQCDLVMISYYIGSVESGIYSMSHTVGFMGYNVMGQIMAAWSPWVYRRLEKHEYKNIHQNFSLMVVLGLYTSIGLMTISPELIRVFLTDEYLPCIYIIPPIVVAMFFQYVYGFLYDLEYYYKKTRYIASASATAAILNLILNFLFIPRYGYLVAAYTTLISYLALFIMNYIFAKKLHVKEVYNTCCIIWCVIGIVIYMGIMFVLIDLILWRYIVLVIITILLVCLEYNKAIAFLKVIKTSEP